MNQLAPIDLLKSVQSRVNQILPKVVDEKRFLQIILEEFRKNPKLAKCTQESLVAAVVKCSREGLEPGEECYLLPRWNKKNNGYECCYQRGYPGILTLARRTGEFTNIRLGIVHENDEYELLEGTENNLTIRRAMKNRGEPLFYWASCRTASGEADFEILTVEDANNHRDRFASTRDRNGKIFGNWVDNFDAMAMKTVLIKLLKYKQKSYEKINPTAGEGVYGVDGKDLYRVDYSEQAELLETTIDQINEEIVDHKGDHTSLSKLPCPEWSPQAEKIIDEIDKFEDANKLDSWRGKSGTIKIIDSLGEEASKVYNYADNAYQVLRTG